MFARADEMEAIPKIRRPTAVHTTDQIVSMASRLGWTVGITADDLVGAQCRAVIGLATPGQMIILINGLQYTGYKKFEWGVVGETACADSWGRALKTGEPSLSLPCYAERRYGGVPDEEMLMALSPKHLAKAITGMKALSKNGLRYPIAPYGIQSDVRAGMGVSYAKK